MTTYIHWTLSQPHQTTSTNRSKLCPNKGDTGLTNRLHLIVLAVVKKLIAQMKERKNAQHGERNVLNAAK